MYERLSSAVAEDGELLAALLPAVGPRFNPNLLFASVRYLALVDGGDLPCAPAAFRDYLLGHLDAVRALVSSRVTQTNEVARSSYLLLGFEVARREMQRPLALLEIGSSAGLNLLFDLYRYDYGAYGAVGPGASTVVLKPEILAGKPPVPRRLPDVAWRLGIDLSPLDPRSGEDRRWLRALVWPEHRERERQLELALELAAQSPAPALRGNAADLLEEAADRAPSDAGLVIFHTNTVVYLSGHERSRLQETIARIGSARSAVHLSGEGSPPAPGFELALTMTTYGRGERSERVLAHVTQHARGLAWLAED